MKETAKKAALLGSAPSLEILLKGIARYYYANVDDFGLHEECNNGTYRATLYKKTTGKEFKNVQIVKQKGRYRLERI